MTMTTGARWSCQKPEPLGSHGKRLVMRTSPMLPSLSLLIAVPTDTLSAYSSEGMSAGAPFLGLAAGKVWYEVEVLAESGHVQVGFAGTNIRGTKLGWNQTDWGVYSIGTTYHRQAGMEGGVRAMRWRLRWSAGDRKIAR